MSKATLPSLGWQALMTRTRDTKRAWIGFQTEVERMADGVALEHHGSIVALIVENAVAMGNRGVHTRMLAQRMNKVLLDNGVPYAVGLREHTTCLFERDFRGPIVATGVKRVAFERRDGAWALASVEADG